MQQVTICALMPHPVSMIPEIEKDELLTIKDTILATEEAAKIIKEKNPQTIILVTPHGPVVEDSASISIHPRLKGNFEAFGAPDVIMGFETDDLLTRHILRQTKRLGISLVELTDDVAKNYYLSLELGYGALVPLYYLSKAGFRGQLIHISLGVLAYEEIYTFGKAVQKAIGVAGKRVAVIGSGNLSHTTIIDGESDQTFKAQEFDQEVLQAVKALDVKALLNMDKKLIATAKECCLPSIFFLMGVVGGLDAKGTLLSYEAPCGVGYGVAVITIKNKEKGL